MSEQRSNATLETAGGAKIHRISLEVFPDFWAYVYLVLKDELSVLIDCGSGTDSSHAGLLSGLEQAGLTPSDLSHILLTHAHIDHYGGLSKLKPLTDAKVGVHELDLQTVAHHEAKVALVSRRLGSFLTEAGLSEETCDQLLSIYRFTKALYQSVPVDFTFGQAQGGADEETDVLLNSFEMIHLPGHCPGHVAIRLDDFIFCGDMVVEGVTPHLIPESIEPNNGLDHYLESLNRFQIWANGTRLIFNGHDEVISDLPVRIDSTYQNLIRRMSKALDALSEPLTTAEVCTAVYGETGGYNQLLVIEKTGAYIEYFYQHGMIGITNTDEVEQGLPPRYRRFKAISETEILPKQKHPVVD
ncbi:MAG TPA: MBL fold metallo-hydrolase [Anaerolineales bacterium]|nr:MBL fold metallo-hydrolase [Anaerolineales bacterium]